MNENQASQARADVTARAVLKRDCPEIGVSVSYSERAAVGRKRRKALSSMDVYIVFHPCNMTVPHHGPADLSLDHWLD